MTKTKEQLLNIWFNVWQIPGWLRLLEMTKDYDPENIRLLEEIDEEALNYIADEELREHFRSKKYKEELENWKKELPMDELLRNRIEFLDNEINKLTRILEWIWKNYEDSVTQDLPYFLRKAAFDINNPKRIEGVIRHLTVEKYLLEHPEDLTKSGRLTPEEIERAVSYPFDELIKFNAAGFAICPFHQEKTPSFHFIKWSNRAHCFGCQWHGDVIQFLMDRDGIGFKKAVRSLCGV